MQGGLSDGTGPGEVVVTATSRPTTTTTSSSPQNQSQQPPASPTERLVYGTVWTQDDLIIGLLALQMVLLIAITIRS